MAIDHDNLNLISWLKQQAEARKQFQGPDSDPFPTGAIVDKWLRERRFDPNNPEQQSRSQRIANICCQQDDLAKLMHRVPVEVIPHPVLKGPSKKYEWNHGFSVLAFDQNNIFLLAAEQAAKRVGSPIDPNIYVIQFGDSDDIEERRYLEATGLKTNHSLTLGYPEQNGIQKEIIYHFTPCGEAKVSYVDLIRLSGQMSFKQKTKDVSFDDMRVVERLLPVLRRELVSQL